MAFSYYKFRYYADWHNSDTRNIYINKDAGATRFLKRDGMRGFGFESVVASERVPYNDGVARLGGPYTPAREMQLAIEIVAASYDALRTNYGDLLHYVSPYLDAQIGTLWIYQDTSTFRRIDCWCVKASDLEMHGTAAGSTILTFWAQDPWFIAAASESVFSGATVTDPFTATNAGDCNVWPELKITGNGTNYSIENTTLGKTFAVTLNMDADDILTIDMEAGTVTFHDHSAGTTVSRMDIITAASEFWYLLPGANTIDIAATDCVGGVAQLTWYARYLTI